MTVRELIEVLQKYPMDKRVYHSYNEGYIEVTEYHEEKFLPYGEDFEKEVLVLD